MNAPTGHARTDPAPDPGLRLVNDYLNSFYTGDFEHARTLVADEFTFHGPFLHVTGRNAFFDGARGLRPIVQGHHTLHQWTDGHDVCTVFDLQLESPAGTGTVTMSEWHTVNHAMLTSGRCLFDTATFRALLPPVGQPTAT